MRVSQRLDHSLRALVFLALQTPPRHAPGAEIAVHLGLPQRVVEQRLSHLARARILASKRGAGGGYALAHPASAITVADVVRAIDGEVLDVPRLTASATSRFWAESADSFAAHLEQTSIAMLARRQMEIDAQTALIYYI